MVDKVIYLDHVQIQVGTQNAHLELCQLSLAELDKSSFF